jgi:hypothetical protein
MKLKFVAILLMLHSLVHAQDNHGNIQVAPGGHYLQYADGTPFFWLGDTGWELFHRLSYPEITAYLDNRAAKGFTVIQSVALAEFDGLHKPNRNGDIPLLNDNPATPNENYFKLVDSVIDYAAAKNLVIGLLPTWGDKVTKLWGTGPVVFDSINAFIYGKWIGSRYAAKKNIIWILGGDRPAVKDTNDWRPVWRQMARGIRTATAGKCLIAYHPWGGENSTSQWIQDESWLDINMFQSGHGGGHDVPCWKLVTRDRNMLPYKPTLDAEPNYEDHPVNPWPKWNPDNGYFRDYDVRKQIYRSVFAGACGVTYGHHAIWQFMSAREEVVNYADRGWINAMDRPGAFQAGYLRKLVCSRPYINRIPDSTIIVGDKGTAGSHMEAFRDSANSYAMVYLPLGNKIIVHTGFIRSASIVAWWYDPRKGTAQKIGNLKRTGTMSFDPPSHGPGNDWVLVIDDAGSGYAAP